MNLVKNGAVLLAAISAFAFTSCNKGMSYKSALAWVKKHYTEDSGKSQVKTVNIEWDYTKNVEKDKITMPGVGEVGGNYFTKQAINGQFEIDIGEKKKGTLENHTYTKGISGGSTFFNEAEFIDAFEEHAKETTFSVKGNTLTTKTKYVSDEEIAEGVKVEFNEIDTLTIGEDGYIKAIEYRMYKNNLKLTVDKEYNMGNLDFTMKCTVVERVKPEK